MKMGILYIALWTAIHKMQNLRLTLRPLSMQPFDKIPKKALSTTFTMKPQSQELGVDYEERQGHLHSYEELRG